MTYLKHVLSYIKKAVWDVENESNLQPAKETSKTFQKFVILRCQIFQ